MWSQTQNCHPFYANYEKAKDIFGDRIKGGRLLKDNLFEATNGTLLLLPYKFVRDCKMKTPDKFHNIPKEFRKKTT